MRVQGASCGFAAGEYGVKVMEPAIERLLGVGKVAAQVS